MVSNKNRYKKRYGMQLRSVFCGISAKKKMNPNVKKMSNGMYCLSHRTKGTEQAMRKKYMHSYRNISLNVLLQYEHIFQVHLL